MEREPERLLGRLRETEEELPYELRRAFLEAEPARVVSGLREIAKDESLLADDPEVYSPPVHAETLLGLIGAESATGLLVRNVLAEGRETALGEAAGRALQNIGGGAGLEAALDGHREATSPLERRRMANVLAGFSCDDERIVELLAGELHDQPDGSTHEILLALQRFGDAAAVESIREWFESEERDPEAPVDRHLIELTAHVLRSLDGELTRRHRELLSRARGVDGSN